MEPATITVTCPTCGTMVSLSPGGSVAVCPECQDWLPRAEDDPPSSLFSSEKPRPKPIVKPAASGEFWQSALIVVACLAGLGLAGCLFLKAPASAGCAVLILLLAIGYFVPLVIALSRNHPNAVPILVLNVLLGWSFVGWVAALVWSLTAFMPVPPIPPSECRPPLDP